MSRNRVGVSEIETLGEQDMAATNRESRANTLRRVVSLCPSLLVMLSLFATGCQQRMADSPYYKPYRASKSFGDGKSERPLEAGVVHRNQEAADNPLLTGLTAAEWERARKEEAAPAVETVPTEAENRERNIGAPRYDPRDAALPQVYVKDFPFEITARDLRIGQEKYTRMCAECHGALGNGQGKIWERGYLKPTSFHTIPVEGNEPAATGDIPLGFSRGYWRWGIEIPLREVPVGYYYEVISRGYGGMPDYRTQLRDPADRWRVIAYIRALQLSQYADLNQLPADAKTAVTNAADGKTSTQQPADGGHK